MKLPAPFPPRPARALATLAVSLLAACGTPYRPPVVMEADARFPGLAGLLAEASGKTVDVLLVHGICTHDASWAPRVVAQLGQAMGATAPAPGPVPAPAQDGQVQIVPATLDTSYGKLRVDALIWSPLTQRIKKQLCYDRSEPSAQCQGLPTAGLTRARLNARGKDLLVDDCLPDAIVYEGAAREQMQLAMRAAILQVLAGRETERETDREKAAAAPAPLVVIAHSMGSKLLFDTLLRMAREDAAAPAARLARQAVDSLRYLVMAANQIPLLTMADQPLAPAGAMHAASAAGDSLQQLLALRRAAAGTGRLHRSERPAVLHPAAQALRRRRGGRVQHPRIERRHLAGVAGAARPGPPRLPVQPGRGPADRMRPAGQRQLRKIGAYLSL